MDPMLSQILAQFRLVGTPISCERYGFGHINVTYLVVTDQGPRYILQKINNSIFKDVPGLMGNIAAVTNYLRKIISDPRGVLTLIPTTDGTDYLKHTDGSFWRVYDFVEQSICLQAPECTDDFYQSAVAFGTFQQQLKDFPADTLCEVIPNFHNTADRYRIFKEALADIEICRLLESYIGKEAVVAMIDQAAGEPLTFSCYPRNSRYIPDLIQSMLRRIAQQK